jgi:hypothetical protein
MRHVLPADVLSGRRTEREFFIEELEEVQGGRSRPKRWPCKCCLPTTMACCEEGECDTCCW